MLLVAGFAPVAQFRFVLKCCQNIRNVFNMIHTTRTQYVVTVQRNTGTSNPSSADLKCDWRHLARWGAHKEQRDRMKESSLSLGFTQNSSIYFAPKHPVPLRTENLISWLTDKLILFCTKGRPSCWLLATSPGQWTISQRRCSLYVFIDDKEDKWLIRRQSINLAYRLRL